MESQYYCHACAIRLGHMIPGLSTAPNLTGSNYQFGKYLKHTAPTSYGGLLSIFSEPDYVQYQVFTVNTSLSGCCQIDDRGRTNLIWYAGRHVGMTFENGRYFCPDDSIKVVLHNDYTLIHSFPVNYELHYINRCRECDSPIPT